MTIELHVGKQLKPNQFSLEELHEVLRDLLWSRLAASERVIKQLRSAVVEAS